MLFFNNDGGDGVLGTSLAVEVELDLEAMTATRVWTYEGGTARAWMDRPLTPEC
jgi:hypothetical protein